MSAYVQGLKYDEVFDMSEIGYSGSILY
jgi:hypothetical protein